MEFFSFLSKLVSYLGKNLHTQNLFALDMRKIIIKLEVKDPSNLQPHYSNKVFGNVHLLAILRGNHCRHPIAIMGVVDHLGHCPEMFCLYLIMNTSLVFSCYEMNCFVELSYQPAG